jgi:deoxyribodipyrimidine photo-lyase
MFTPFWRALKQRLTLTPPLPAPAKLAALEIPNSAPTLDALGLLPAVRWDQDFYAHWQPGEKTALHVLKKFIASAANDYATARDRPDLDGTSRLSPHLHLGELSPRQVWWALLSAAAEGLVSDAATESYLREIGWREFAAYVLHHFPHTAEQPMDARFERFPWHTRKATPLRAWQRGRTGIPIVDAGMRQLWHSGWMHNRVRMIVASFLTKNCLIDWRAGARWFWDTLLDADLANNSLGWQWTAGCGVDAAPYFRIFNPVRQGEKFDPHGAYVRRWVPELAALDHKHIHQPWAAPPALLAGAGIRLGDTYPRPLVDLAQSRADALRAFASLKHL